MNEAIIGALALSAIAVIAMFVVAFSKKSNSFWIPVLLAFLGAVVLAREVVHAVVPMGIMAELLCVLSAFALILMFIIFSVKVCSWLKNY